MCNFLWWWLNVACTMHSIMSSRNVQLDHFLDPHQISPKIQRDSSCVFNISRNTSFNRSSITHFCVAFLYIVSTLSVALKKRTLHFAISIHTGFNLQYTLNSAALNVCPCAHFTCFVPWHRRWKSLRKLQPDNKCFVFSALCLLCLLHIIR